MCTAVPVCIACTAGCSCCRPVHFETGSCCRYVLQGPAYVHICSVRTAVVISRYSALCTVVSLVCRGAALYCLRVKQRRQRHLLLLRSTFGHAQIPKKRKNGAVELVQSVTYPTTPPAPKLIQCQHCPAKLENEQGHAVHRKILHPLVDEHEGTRLVNSMRDGRKVAMSPWEGFGMGRCWVARLGTGPDEKTVFQLSQSGSSSTMGSATTMTSLSVAAAPESVGCPPTGRRRQLSRNYDDIRSKRTLYLQRIG